MLNGLTDDEVALLSALLDPRNGIGRTIEEAMNLIQRANRLFMYELVEVFPMSEIVHPRNDLERNAIRITAVGRACVQAILTMGRSK